MSYNKYIYRIRVAAFRRAVRKLHCTWDDKNVLDVGSGTGFYIKQWKSLDVGELSGVDITNKAVSMLTDDHPDVEFFELDIGVDLSGAMADKKFDVVSAFDMLYHIVDDEHYRKAFKNFSVLVKPGGMLIFSENLLQGDEVRLEHQVSRKENDVFLMLTENGFKLKRRIPMFIFMNDPVRTKNRLMRKLFSFTYIVASKNAFFGGMIGMILYPIDLFLIKVLNYGPSTETFVWEKISKNTK